MLSDWPDREAAGEPESDMIGGEGGGGGNKPMYGVLATISHGLGLKIPPKLATQLVTRGKRKTRA